MSSRRKSVRVREIARNSFGPIYVLRITYTDGRRTWGVSESGMLSLFGFDRAAANEYIRRIS